MKAQYVVDSSPQPSTNRVKKHTPTSQHLCCTFFFLCSKMVWNVKKKKKKVKLFPVFKQTGRKRKWHCTRGRSCKYSWQQFSQTTKKHVTQPETAAQIGTRQETSTRQETRQSQETSAKISSFDLFSEKKAIAFNSFFGSHTLAQKKKKKWLHNFGKICNSHFCFSRLKLEGRSTKWTRTSCERTFSHSCHHCSSNGLAYCLSSYCSYFFISTLETA